MSDGLGWVERAILDALGEGPASTSTLVALVFGTATPGPYIPHGASRSQVRSVARAVRSLQRKGLVVILPRSAARRRRHVRLVDVDVER
jgi:sulfite exporter TauE/SafE